ncbi:MAG: phosphate propanoyltransferase [Candidatus Pacearchaeota archaeon]|jgi:propanediol utilization protein
MKIPIEISARHIHLSQKDIELLFGKGYQLKPMHKISQPGQFASQETIVLINKEHIIENVRILGPARKKSQAEISLTDAYKLKLNHFPPLRISGDLKDCPKITIRSYNNMIKIPVIIAKRHLHVSEKQAKELDIKDKEIIKIKVLEERGLIFDNVVVRVEDKSNLSFQLDTDEGNAAGINKKNSFGEIVR